MFSNSYCISHVKLVIHFLFPTLQLECALRGSNTRLLELSSNRKWFWCEKKHFQSYYFIRHIHCSRNLFSEITKDCLWFDCN